MKMSKARPRTSRLVVVFALILSASCSFSLIFFCRDSTTHPEVFSGIAMDPKIRQAVKAVRDGMRVQEAAIQFAVRTSTANPGSF